ncbi:MAG: mandelate racemase/muconate lactonizing enzyme family protein [Gemmatimonadaceae bacterium]|jgi:L-alanine-DL-glutamate epimerase-like enolase superfamily enzyme|nr:mandelate racemase/muconate lactonizing enzyme family protein [Gemmatimonadaceae bacterium]MCU0627287.1 mandelate racemase/muconate lactonizing enzyme family protein [Gemmatimonadaceae bacterium]
MPPTTRRDALRLLLGGLATAGTARLDAVATAASLGWPAAAPARRRAGRDAAGDVAPEAPHAPPDFERPVLRPLHALLPDPLRIAAIDVVDLPGAAVASRDAGRWVRVHLADGTIGAIPANDQLRLLLPLLRELVVPFFVGRDARDLESLVDGVYEAERNYKFAGMPFWNCVGHVELALLDALARRAALPVHRLVPGDARRDTIPMYVTRLTRETTPDEEVARVRDALARTGARAVKIKVGGRMRRNADAAPGRTEALVPALRRAVGDDVTIYADANGSYDVREGIRIGRLLEAHGVAIYEEPCPWQDYDGTRAVTQALRTVQVAGGEQETSLHGFATIVRDRVLDIVQPDLFYNGGFVRALRVARMAAGRGRAVGPHTPKALPAAAPLLHFAAACPNITPFMEYRAEAAEFQEGRVAVPVGIGFGHERDARFWAAAQVV